MEFFRQDYWSNLSSPGDLLDPGIEPGSPALQADSLPSEPLVLPKWGSSLGLSFLLHLCPPDCHPFKVGTVRIFLSFSAHHIPPRAFCSSPVPFCLHNFAQAVPSAWSTVSLIFSPFPNRHLSFSLPHFLVCDLSDLPPFVFVCSSEKQK